MKRRFTALLTAFAVIISFTACSGRSETMKTQETANPYYPDNDIITTEDLEDGRMVVVIDIQYNVSTSNIAHAVESRFPEVNVVLRLQSTSDTKYQTEKSLEYGQMGDIIFGRTGIPNNEEALEKYFIDLSGVSFINNYYQNALDNVAVNGRIYMLPGFSEIFGIVYDRTLFEEEGWELPQSRDEFIALCRTIREEKGDTPFMPTLRYGRMAMLISHAFHYESVIAGMENQRWLQAYRMGEESFVGHMEPLFEGMKELYDEGVLPEECFEIEAGVRSTMLYKEHTTAMTMENQNAPTYAASANSDHEYGFMPFWNGNGADSDYVVTSPGFNIYVNKNLEKPGNEEKLDKVMEILEYVSTPEGQRALMSAESATISNVKGTDSTSGGNFMAGVAGTIEKGNIFQEVRYTDLSNNNPFQVAFREAVTGYLYGGMTLDEALIHCDKGMETVRSAVEPQESVYGTAAENFTVLETAEYVADTLRENADADLALVMAKWLAYGETGNFYEGDINDTVLKFVSLDYVTNRNPQYNRLVTVNLTGAQVLEILNYPYFGSDIIGDSNVSSKNTSPDQWVENDNPCYWVPSGFKMEYAPLLPQNNTLSMANMDGSAFDMEKTYKVAVWSGCFSNMPITDYFQKDTLEAMEDITVVSDSTSIELIKAAVEKAGEISPPRDGRFIIRWDVKPEGADE